MTKQTKQVKLPEELELSEKITNLIKLARNGYFGTENYNELMITLLRLVALIGYIKQDKTQAQQEVVEKVKALRKTDRFAQSLNTFDGKTKTFNRLSDADINYNEALDDVLEALQKNRSNLL